MGRKLLLKGFKCPKSINFEPSQVDDFHGVFEAYPFERGYGTTIGNSLRRILLSSIPGYAVTALRVTIYKNDGQYFLSSEYESIPGVEEDTPDIINRLKQLCIQFPDIDMSKEHQKTLFLEFSGARKVTGADFAIDDAKITNPDIHIMTLMDDAKFALEIQIDLFRGYVPSEVNAKYIEEVGTIPIDALFSPVKRVRYHIENTRVGQRNDFDKLILEIWTDGTVRSSGCVGRSRENCQRSF